MKQRPMILNLNKLSKRFYRYYIFEDVSAELQHGDVLVISGQNGSGKSTLLKMIAGLLSLSKGSIEYKINEYSLAQKDLLKHLGFFAPYFRLFDQLSAEENLKIFSQAHDIALDGKAITSMFAKFQLEKKQSVKVRNYSSGMKQRLKLMTSLIHEPEFLLLDEPTSNLDQYGKALIEETIEAQKQNGICIICTNESNELAWGNKQIEL